MHQKNQLQHCSKIPAMAHFVFRIDLGCDF